MTTLLYLKINLNSNYICDSGTIALSNTLQRLTNLREIDISLNFNNDLTNLAETSLLNSLEKMKNRTKINLSIKTINLFWEKIKTVYKLTKC